jgi:hypothetical protein
MRVRRGGPRDIPALLHIKQALTFANSVQGGFLLGCDEQGYAARLRDGRVWVLETAQAEIVGFATTLPPQALLASGLWATQDRFRWVASRPADLTEVGYFDQLAVLPRARHRPALALAFTALWDLLPTCRYVVTSTVAAPVRNGAAVSFIQGIGGQRIAQLEESYPGFGALTSDIWILPSERAMCRVRAGGSRAARWVERLGVALR